MSAPPERIGPYRIEGQLGAGGMGAVYRAWDERLERWVAIKLIRPESAGNATALERFRREARAAARLSHPAIVQIYDILPWSSGEAIVMEMVEGPTLVELLGKGPLDFRTALRLGRDVAEGLAAAHAQGILHRDLKAENVIVSRDGRAKILDFGLAKRLDPGPSGVGGKLTQEHTVVGTSRSMSPEQARGLPLDSRSDLFSFGLLLYEMLAGCSPFLADTALDTMARICATRQRPLKELAPRVPAVLSDLVDRLLEKDPARRPQTAREVAEDLEALQGWLATPAPEAEATWIEGRPAVPSSHGYRAVRGGLRWAAPIGAVLLIAAGLLWQLQRPSAPEKPESKAPEPPKPVYVAVTKPEIGAEAREETELLAAGLRIAVLRALLALEGPSPISAQQVDEVSGTPVQIARALAAQEVVSSRLDCRRDTCEVSLARIDGKAGRLRWTQSFSATADRPYALAEAVQGYLRQGFPELRLRPGAPALEVRPEDYTEYLRLRQAFESKREGQVLPPETLFARLEGLRSRSPRFLEPYIFEAEVRQQRFKSSQDPGELDRAEQLLSHAHGLAASDPRPLSGSFGVALIRGDFGRAEEALNELERLQPGDPSLMINRSRLLARRGDAEGARALMREGVRRYPSWRNLFRAAEMEYGQGRLPQARQYVDRILARYPESYEGLSLLAQIELLHGDVRRAAALYTELVQRSPRPVEQSNLGTAHLYLGDYAKAEERFREMVRTEPQNPFSLLNLADALLLQERGEEAAVLYRQVLGLTRAEEDWQVLSARAQALAHLGDGAGAIGAVQKMLRTGPEGAQTAYEASLVYCLLGDRTAARFNAHKALEQGVAPRLFELPWFDPLRGGDPVLEKSLGAAVRAPV